MSKQHTWQPQTPAPKPEPRKFEAVGMVKYQLEPGVSGWRAVTVVADESMIIEQTEPNLPLIAKDEVRKSVGRMFQKLGLA